MFMFGPWLQSSGYQGLRKINARTVMDRSQFLWQCSFVAMRYFVSFMSWQRNRHFLCGTSCCYCYCYCYRRLGCHLADVVFNALNHVAGCNVLFMTVIETAIFYFFHAFTSCCRMYCPRPLYNHGATNYHQYYFDVVYRTSCTVYYPDQQMHNIYIYIYINNILYIVSTPACFDASASSAGSLFLLLC